MRMCAVTDLQANRHTQFGNQAKSQKTGSTLSLAHSKNGRQANVQAGARAGI